MILRVVMGKVNKDIELHGCELCKKMIRLIDGRLSLNENEKEVTQSGGAGHTAIFLF